MPSGVYQRAPTCKRGHPRVEANLRLLSNGERRCRECEKLRRQRYYAKAHERRRSRKQRSNWELHRRRRYRKALLLLIDHYEGDDLNRQAVHLARQCGLTEEWAQFELRWQLGFYDLPEEER